VLATAQEVLTEGTINRHAPAHTPAADAQAGLENLNGKGRAKKQR